MDLGKPMEVAAAIESVTAFLEAHMLKRNGENEEMRRSYPGTATAR